MEVAVEKALGDALRLVLREALALISVVPVRALVKLRREFGPEPGHVGLHDEQLLVPDLSAITVMLVMADENSVGVDALSETIAAHPNLAGRSLVDGGGKPIEAPESRRWWLRHGLISPFVGQYLALRPDGRWNDAAYEDVFADLVRQLDGEALPVRVLAPLTGVESDVDRIELDERTAIVKLTDDDLTKLYDRFGPRQAFGLPPMTQMDLLTWSHAVEHRSEYAVSPAMSVGVLNESSQRAIPDALTALRLVRESGAATAFVWTQPLRRWFHLGSDGTAVQYPLSRSAFTAGPHLTIGEEDVPVIQQLFAALRAVEHANTDARRRFELALGRLNSSSERLTTEDRLIDYWVALETLFAHDGRAEIAYRARTRVSKYISDNIGERKQIAQTLSYSYDRRSKIVHGDKPKADLPELTSKTGEILRRAVRQILETGAAVDTEMLDLG